MQGESVTITSDKLDVTDADTDEAILSFLLLEEPGHGELWNSGYKMDPTQEFIKPDITAGDVEYHHNGDSAMSDMIRLEVTDGMHNFPVNLEVVVIPRPVVPEPTQRNPSEVTLIVPEKSQTELSRDKYFLTPPDEADKDLTFTILTAPTNGDILRDGMPLNKDSIQKFGASDISNGRIVYSHNGDEIGPFEINDQFVLLARDINGLAKPMNIITHVRIIPVDNQYPVVTVLQNIAVDEGGKASMNPSHVEITDEDTNPDDIICRIDPQPLWGFLENISPLPGSERSRAGIAITDFRASDLPDEFINYVQSIHLGYEPTHDEFVISCRDKANNESGGKRIEVIINPVNDETPKIEHSRWRVREGDILNLDESLLDCRDMDVPEDELTFIIIEAPKFGRIIHLQANTLGATASIDQFTCMQLRYHEIAYEHDDSENFDDKVKLQLTDGKHTTEDTIQIDIIPVDDETPRVEINHGLSLVNDQLSSRIGSDLLKVTDIDSSDKDLMMIVSYPPSLGDLKLDDGTPEGKSLSVGDLFTMDHLSYNRIIYTRREGTFPILN